MMAYVQRWSHWLRGCTFCVLAGNQRERLILSPRSNSADWFDE